MVDAFEHLEAIGPGDVAGGAVGAFRPEGLVARRPDVQHRNRDRPESPRSDSEPAARYQFKAAPMACTVARRAAV